MIEIKTHKHKHKRINITNLRNIVNHFQLVFAGRTSDVSILGWATDIVCLVSTVKLDFVHSLCRILKCGTCDCTSLKSYLLRDTQLVNCEYLGGVYIRLPRSRVSDKFFDKICFRLYERRASILWRDLAIDYRDLSLESCKFPYKRTFTRASPTKRPGPPPCKHPLSLSRLYSA